MPQYPYTPQASQTHLNITAATVVKASPGRLFHATVVVGGSSAGSINDTATTGGVAASNEITALGTLAGVAFDSAAGWPCSTGIVVTPGTGQTIAVAFS